MAEYAPFQGVPLVDIQQNPFSKRHLNDWDRAFMQSGPLRYRAMLKNTPERQLPARYPTTSRKSMARCGQLRPNFGVSARDSRESSESETSSQPSLCRSNNGSVASSAGTSVDMTGSPEPWYTIYPDDAWVVENSAWSEEINYSTANEELFELSTYDLGNVYQPYGVTAGNSSYYDQREDRSSEADCPKPVLRYAPAGKRSTAEPWCLVANTPNRRSATEPNDFCVVWSDPKDYWNSWSAEGSIIRQEGSSLTTSQCCLTGASAHLADEPEQPSSGTIMPQRPPERFQEQQQHHHYYHSDRSITNIFPASSVPVAPEKEDELDSCDWLAEVEELFGPVGASTLEALAATQPSLDDFSSPESFTTCSPGGASQTTATPSSSRTPGSSASPATSTKTSNSNNSKRKRNATDERSPPNDDDGQSDDERRKHKLQKPEEAKLSERRWDCPLCRRPPGVTAGGCQAAHNGLTFRSLLKHFRDCHLGCKVCGLRFTTISAEDHMLAREADRTNCQEDDAAASQVDLDLLTVRTIERIYNETKKRTLGDYQGVWARWWSLIWKTPIQAPDGLHQPKISFSSADMPQVLQSIAELWGQEANEGKLASYSKQDIPVLLGCIEKVARMYSYSKKARARSMVNKAMSEQSVPLETPQTTIATGAMPDQLAAPAVPDFGFDGVLPPNWAANGPGGLTLTMSQLDREQYDVEQYVQGDYDSQGQM